MLCRPEFTNQILPDVREETRGGEMSKDYPLHPGQTHAQPLYAQIPLEEYERLMAENKRLKDVLKRHGITLLKED